MDRHTRVFGAAEHQFEREIDRWTNANDHVSALLRRSGDGCGEPSTKIFAEECRFPASTFDKLSKVVIARSR